jgi:hypothetical protein
VRRANAPAKRFIALSDPISFNLLHARATGTPSYDAIPSASREVNAQASSVEDAAAEDVDVQGANAQNANTSNPASNGKEDGKVPVVGVGEGNTSLLALLSSAVSTAESPSTVLASPSTTLAAIEPSGTDVVAAGSDGSAGAQNITGDSSQPSNEDGEVPVVGVGSDNTSLLALLSSSLTPANETLSTATAAGDSGTPIQTLAQDASAATLSSTSKAPCPNNSSASPTTTAEPIQSPGPAEATAAPNNVSQDGSSIGPIDTATTVVPLVVPQSVAQTTLTVISTTVFPLAQNTSSPAVAAVTSEAPQPLTDLTSIAAGDTATLPLSPLVTTTVVVQDPATTSTSLTTQAPNVAVAASSTADLASLNSVEGQNLPQPGLSSTSLPQEPSGPAAPPAPPAPVPLATTTVTPLNNAAPASQSTTPIPDISILQPSTPSATSVSTGDTPPPPPDTGAGGSPSPADTGATNPADPAAVPEDVIIPLGDFSIIVHHSAAPARAAANAAPGSPAGANGGNSVVPVIGSFITVTVTATEMATTTATVTK